MDNVSEKIDKWLGKHPEYAYLISGYSCSCFWESYSTGSGLGNPVLLSGGNWLTRSEKGHTVFWKGVFVVIIILILAFIYFTTY